MFAVRLSSFVTRIAVRPPTSAAAFLTLRRLSTSPAHPQSQSDMSGFFKSIGHLAGITSVHIDEAALKPSIYDYTVKDGKSQDYPLAQHKGKVILAVNVASQCGFTKQYAGLQKLYSDLESRGLVILGFPCNQFGEQEPGSNEEIENFCSRKFSVAFPILDKVDVNGEQSEPLFQFLKSKTDKSNIVWNFSKFLIDREGNVVKKYGSRDTPEAIRADIEALL